METLLVNCTCQGDMMCFQSPGPLKTGMFGVLGFKAQGFGLRRLDFRANQNAAELGFLCLKA